MKKYMRRMLTLILVITLMIPAIPGKAEENKIYYLPIIVSNELFPNEGEPIYTNEKETTSNLIYRPVLKVDNDLYMTGEVLQELTGYKYDKSEEKFTRGTKQILVNKKKEKIDASYGKEIELSEVTYDFTGLRDVDGTTYFSLSQLLPHLNVTWKYDVGNSAIIWCPDYLSLWDDEIQNLSWDECKFDYDKALEKIKVKGNKGKANQAIYDILNKWNTVKDGTVETVISVVTIDNMFGYDDYYDLFTTFMDSEDEITADMFEYSEDNIEANYRYSYLLSEDVNKSVATGVNSKQLSSLLNIFSLYEDVVYPTVHFATTFDRVNLERKNTLGELGIEGAYNYTSDLSQNIAWDVYGKYENCFEGISDELVHNLLGWSVDALISSITDVTNYFGELKDQEEMILELSKEGFSWVAEDYLESDSVYMEAFCNVNQYEKYQNELYESYNESIKRSNYEICRSSIAYGMMYMWLSVHCNRAMAWYSNKIGDEAAKIAFEQQAIKGLENYLMYSRLWISVEHDSIQSQDEREQYRNNLLKMFEKVNLLEEEPLPKGLDYKTIYADAVNDAINYCSQYGNLGEPYIFCEYTLSDVTGDGILELFVHVNYNKHGADLLIYSYDGQNTERIGNIPVDSNRNYVVNSYETGFIHEEAYKGSYELKYYQWNGSDFTESLMNSMDDFETEKIKKSLPMVDINDDSVFEKMREN